MGSAWGREEMSRIGTTTKPSPAPHGAGEGSVGLGKLFLVLGAEPRRGLCSRHGSVPVRRWRNRPNLLKCSRGLQLPAWPKMATAAMGRSFALRAEASPRRLGQGRPQSHIGLLIV